MQKSQAGKLVPAEPALLSEAGRWVDSWQEPMGHTNYDAALQMAERYMEADCEYIFSDGLSDYAVVLLEVHLMLCFPCHKFNVVVGFLMLCCTSSDCNLCAFLRFLMRADALIVGTNKMLNKRKANTCIPACFMS